MQTFQLNPSLSIISNPNLKKIRFGHLAPHAFEMEDNFDQIEAVINQLKSQRQLLRTEIINIVESNFTESASQIVDDLINLKIIVPYHCASERYARHKLYYQNGNFPLDAQDLLATKSILLIGVGGIGSTCATLLNAAGIGGLILADSDKVELSNLTRTTLFEQTDISSSKVEKAKEQLKRRNSTTQIECIPEILTQKTYSVFAKAFERTDLVILSGDSGPELHKQVYQLSIQTNTPIMNSGYIETHGVIGPITLGKNQCREDEIKQLASADIQLNPNYQAPSYGPLNSLVSSITVNEVIRYFLTPQETKTLNNRLVI